VNLKEFKTFVAKQIDSERKFDFITAEAIDLVQSETQLVLDQKSLKISMNENFILMLASLAEYHLEDALTLLSL
jgi:hypothetical protein